MTEPWREVLVHAVHPEADGVLSLTLVDPDGGVLPRWRPGAHLDLMAGAVERQYSLCGRVDDVAGWRVAVLREQVSRGGSAWIHEVLKPGDRVRVRGPRNNFELRPHRRYLFIAGGIGITALLPMIADVAARDGVDWRLVYGGRRRSSMAFLDELAVHGDRVTLWPEDELGLIDLAGLLARTHPDTGIYCCGPEPLLAAVELRCAGRSPGSLRVERFAARPVAGPLPPSSGFQVQLASSARTVDVTAEQSILEALEADGVFPPSSCLAGVCGSCETAVLAGIPEHRDSILDEQEREQGDTMMICVSRSASMRLVLDL